MSVIFVWIKIFQREADRATWHKCLNEFHTAEASMCMNSKALVLKLWTMV